MIVLCISDAHTNVWRHAHTLPFISVYKITGSSLCGRPTIKAIVTLILKSWGCFVLCAEQMVPASSCDQDFSSFSASLNYCRRCAELLLTELIYNLLVFLLEINQTHL